MEFYTVLDANEIDGQGKDVDIVAEEGDATWTKVLIHPAQQVPAGNYDFVMSLQATVSSTNNSVVYRVVGDVPWKKLNSISTENDQRLEKLTSSTLVGMVVHSELT